MTPFEVHAPAWMKEAACANVGVDMFFPGKGETDICRIAKRVCINCPVREQCLEYALDRKEKWGVWGGTSERERRRLLKERAA